MTSRDSPPGGSRPRCLLGPLRPSLCDLVRIQIQGMPSCQGTKHKGATIVALELKSHPARSPRPRDLRVLSQSGHRFRRLRRLRCPYELRLLTPIPWNTGGCGWSTRYREEGRCQRLVGVSGRRPLGPLFFIEATYPNGLLRPPTSLPAARCPREGNWQFSYGTKWKYEN